jgi:hypothetical protein
VGVRVDGLEVRDEPGQRAILPDVFGRIDEEPVVTGLAHVAGA